jgi:DNA-binding PadR family transcriptional regulator
MRASPPNRADNRSRFAILGALSLRPMSGYDLRQFFEANLSYFWSESYGQIYPMLRALAESGLVEAVPNSLGRRKPYRITDAGRQALGAWLAAPAAPETGRVEILLKLFFASQAPPEAIDAHLARHRAEHEARLREYAAVRERLLVDHADHPDLVHWLATLAYGTRTSESMLSWCDDVDRLRRTLPRTNPR